MAQAYSSCYIPCFINISFYCKSQKNMPARQPAGNVNRNEVDSSSMKKRTLQTTGILLFVFIIIAAGLVYKMYNKPHRSAETEDGIAITAIQLSAEYEKNEGGANKKYLDKAIQVTGVVADIATNQQNMAVITLQGSDISGVQCTLQQNTSGIKKADIITLKGFCTGFLTDVIIDRCILIPVAK
jgi:uncharacterized protein YpmB